MKLVLKGWIRCIFQVSPGHFSFMRWSSLLELTGDNDIATSTVAVIRMYFKEYAWYGSTAGEVASTTRGQLNRKLKYFTVCPRSRLRVLSRETRSAVRSRVSLLILQTQAEYDAYSRNSSWFT